MVTEVKILPQWGEGMGCPGVTRLLVRIDVSSILSVLQEYDLWIQSILTVQTPFWDGTVVPYRYPSSQVYRNVMDPYLAYDLTVIGTIPGVQAITCETVGHYLWKE